MPVTKCTKNGKDGYKWGDQGVCFTGPDAEQRAAAVGRAIKAQDSTVLYDKASVLKATVDEVSGFLTAPVVLARVGVQYYYGYELGLNDRATDKIGVYRPAEEVFDSDSINTFINLVVTDKHSVGLVTIDNVKNLQIGTVSQVDKNLNEQVLDGILTITDKNKIEEIINKRKNTKDKNIEVSVGYLNELVEKSGTYNGETYEYIQTKIKANHLAIVDKGRCGSECSITLDTHGGVGMVITIDGIQFDVENQQLAQAIEKMKKSHDAKMKEKDQEKEEEMKKKDQEKEEEMEKMKKEKDKADAAKDALAKTVLDEKQLNKLISDRAALLVQAQSILKDKMLECTDCPREIKAAVIDHVLDLGDLSAKSDDYINASYDLAIKMHTKAKDSIYRLGKDFKLNDKKPADREDARTKYINDHLKVKA